MLEGALQHLIVGIAKRAIPIVEEAVMLEGAHAIADIGFRIVD